MKLQKHFKYSDEENGNEYNLRKRNTEQQLHN